MFQPQIRIVCGKGTKIVPGRGTDAASDDEKEDEVLYCKKESLARGHMTSAVWRGVDPETGRPGPDLDFPECAGQPGFAWIDGNILPGADRKKFSACDARTEFMPMYNVASPDFAWSGKNPPQLDTSAYAEEYDKDSLRRSLDPIHLQYAEWIDGLRGQESMHEDAKERIIRAAEDAHRRIRRGIDLVCEDDDARLAFCFANRAMHEQSKWDGRQGMRLRPFQLAFILMSAESVLKARSDDRDVCDLLWIPTGGGKTEAYLFLVAMVAAYRRRRDTESGQWLRSGEGVSVISRYTLRLLTIQQFRRTAALFTAMECLRVEGLGEGTVGWRPRGMQHGGDFLWGTAPFSVGLWVGRTVTPNKLGTEWFNRKSSPGALDVLKNLHDRGDHGEPAQILECPACKSVLATPKMGLKSEAWIHYVIRADADNLDLPPPAQIKAPVKILECKTSKNRAEKVFTVSFRLRSGSRIRDADLESLWSAVEKRLKQKGIDVELAAASPSRPGYFIRNYLSGDREKECDFEIFCPNPDCRLVTNWAGGSPQGRIHGRIPDRDLADAVCGARAPDDNHFVDVIDAFAVERNLADRIPIPALTVDEQVYGRLPTMVVSTVDKLARIPFEPKSGALFGNVDHHNCVSGYYRLTNNHPEPAGRSDKNYAKMSKKVRRPDLVIQDELHLIDGPLGSMVGIYEAAVDHLCSGPNTKIKYIASTATAKRSADHVRALFARRLAVFPPKGLDADDRFFVREERPHPLQDGRAGRLYVGVCAPGRGALAPIVRIWSRLAQSAGEHRGRPGIDPFWTIVGYFNTVRELAGARALYRQDIPERIQHLADLAGSEPRTVSEEGGQELSGRTPSTDLPSILDLLDERSESGAALDGLFTTSMFGTGVDVQRLGAMLVNGQPKTSSAYIQSTGRVGRKSGAIVVTVHRASKPRDLSHYEFFVRNHSQLHRFVEPPTVFPFARRVREIAQGPVMVGILRNARRSSRKWHMEGSAADMGLHSEAPEVAEATEILESRSQVQPEARRPPEGGPGTARAGRWKTGRATQCGTRT